MCGPVSVPVSVLGASNSIVFRASALAGPPTRIAPISSTSQSGTVGTTTAPLVVAVQDANACPVSGLGISFAITSGGGSLSTATATTDSQGRAQSLLTLGTTAGANAAEARASGLAGAPVVFSA